MPRGVYIRTDETRQILSNAQKGKFGVKNNFYGKKHTEEYKQKASESRLGTKLSEATKEKQRLAHLGRKYKPMSEEGRRNMSLAKVGIKHTEEHNRKIGLGLLGKRWKMSEQGKKNLSIAKLKNPTRYWLGKKRPPISEYHRQRLKEYNTGRKPYVMTDDVRENMSVAQKKSYLKRTVWNKGLVGYLAGEANPMFGKRGELAPNWKGGISENPYPVEFNTSLKRKIRERDNYICRLCGISEEESITKYGRKLCVNHIDFNKQNCSEDNLNTLCVSCNFKVNYDRLYWTDFFIKQINSIK